MASIDWQDVKDKAEQALLDIATDQRPRTITYAGRTVQLMTISDAEQLLEIADRQLARAASDGDPVSVAEWGDFI